MAAGASGRFFVNATSPEAAGLGKAVGAFTYGTAPSADARLEVVSVGSRDQLEAESAGGAEFRRVGLDGGRVHDAVEVRRHRRAVLRPHDDAEGDEARCQIRVLPLVEGAVRALDDMAAGGHELGSGFMPAPARPEKW